MRFWLLATLGTLVMTPISGQHHENPQTLEEVMNFVKISPDLATSGQIPYDRIPDLKKDGYGVVINLAPAHQERNGEEGFRVVEQGITYFHIPVNWREPSQEHLQQFFVAMDAAKGEKVFVHCFANMRVSVFVYLYRTLRLGVDHQTAWKDVLKVWDPTEADQWTAFIETARKQAAG